METYSYIPRGVCATGIRFSIENGRLHDVQFTNGCNGNLKAIGRLLEGADAAHSAEILRGNTCGMKRTSCADQLAQALEKALSGELRPA